MSIPKAPIVRLFPPKLRGNEWACTVQCPYCMKLHRHGLGVNRDLWGPDCPRWAGCVFRLEDGSTKRAPLCQQYFIPKPDRSTKDRLRLRFLRALRRKRRRAGP